MDRTHAQKHFGFAAMSPTKCVALQRVLHTKRERVDREPDTDATAGRALPQTPVLWRASDDNVVELGRVPRQYQAHHAPDARHGATSAPARSAHEQAAPGAQDLPVFIARYGDSLLERGMVFRHHLHPDGARIHVSGRGDGLVQSLRNRVGIVQHTRCGFLRSRLEDCFKMRTTRNFQYRPGQSIHQHGVDRYAARRARFNQHGRSRSLLRQYLHRASLAQREVRRYLHQIVRRWPRFASRIIGVFPLLQSRTSAHESGFTDTRAMLCGTLKQGRYFRDFAASLRSGLALRAFRLQRKRPALHEAAKCLPLAYLPPKKGGPIMTLVNTCCLLC